jgi:hypothetical protein
MLKANLWNKSVPRVELDQRAHDARLRLERIERLLVPRAAVADSWLRRVFCLFRLGISGDGSRGSRTRGPLSDRRPSRMPQFTKPGSKCVVRSVARHGFRSTILLLDEGYGGGRSAHAVADRPGRGCQALRNSPTAGAR